MGILANGNNFAKIGGVTTPMVVSQNLNGKQTPPTIKPLNTPSVGSNAQSEAYGKSMNKAFKNTKVFGVHEK